ncbi:putative periodic tryptophan protein 1 protein [Botrytis fragariae]|uniref:Putative periodic tryptophan protein 1 protein n=1 Tax=Botrytis fragariae TaxID=1964551 RepID=A0A8H6EDD4_9HELO|nr:putative periodic tryptophan protein 1 protein [Botrytis fragariae]KAF5868008.1 putative periodic tryptophan protein 1 protein [Botrytis fragariae]
MSMITATAWVPRGFAAPFPTKYNFDEEEFQRIADLAKLQLDDANDDLEEAQNEADNGADPDVMVDDEGSDDEEAPKGVKSTAEEDDDLKEYDLDHYDDEVEEDKNGGEGMAMFGNVKSLAYHESNEEDPYITMAGNAEDEDEDREELQILATDNMLLAAKIEDEIAHLEVYVYEDGADNLYVHHDIMLPAIPLCVEWLDLPVGKPSVDKDSRANFVAVGTFDPDIEIWDLDTVDCMYPNAILGQAGQNKGGDEGAKKKKKNKKSKKANDEFHVDAVLSLAANRHHRNLLASSSADKTVKLWDLHTTTCAKSYTHHTDKVCSLAWHPKESTVLLSGSYDRTVVAADMRAPDAKAPRWGVESDVENVRWDPHDSNYFYVSTESGVIHFHDIRKAPANPSATKPVWMLQAHDDSVSSFDINPTIPGFLATGSGDKQVKLWNIQPTGPTMVVSRDLDVGKVFSTTFAPDEEVSFRLAVAGSKGLVQVWDCSTNPGVRRAFADRVAPVEGEIKERLVGVQNDSESEDDDEELSEAEGGEVESMDEDD